MLLVLLLPDLLLVLVEDELLLLSAPPGFTTVVFDSFLVSPESGVVVTVFCSQAARSATLAAKTKYLFIAVDSSGAFEPAVSPPPRYCTAIIASRVRRAKTDLTAVCAERTGGIFARVKHTERLPRSSIQA